MKFFVRKEIWLPSWQLALTLLVIAISAVAIFVNGIYSFLAVDSLFPDDRADEDGILLVVEGWAPDSVMELTAKRFQEKPYEMIGVTGGAVTAMRYIVGVDSYAQFGAIRLEKEGIPRNKMVVAPANLVARHRTWQMATDLHLKLKELDKIPKKINLITDSIHARRSRMIFQRVFGDEVEVQAMGTPPLDYDPERWWVTSAGLKKIITETLSYSYEGLLVR